MGKFRKSSATQTHRWNGHHRFEHWYRDDTVYFITSKVRDGFHAFESERAKAIFWDRFTHWTAHYRFEPFITALLDNHYHTVGFLPTGENLGPMMQRLHGSISKLVNDTLDVRHLPFFRTRGHRDYFDGCLRTPLQLTRTYRYVQNQSVRAGVVRDAWRHAHTRPALTSAEAMTLAVERASFLPDVPYARYARAGRR